MKLPHMIYEHECQNLMSFDNYLWKLNCPDCTKFLGFSLKSYWKWFMSCPNCGKYYLYVWDNIERIGRCANCNEEFKLA